MRFSIALFALATSASAILLPRQASSALPACATTCLMNADFGNCAESDDSCLCNNSAFITSSTQCIESTCQGQDLTDAETAAQELCAAVGVTLTSSVPLPTGSGAASIASGASSAAASGASKAASAASASGTSPASKPTTTSGAASLTANLFLVALAGFVGVAL